MYTFWHTSLLLLQSIHILLEYSNISETEYSNPIFCESQPRKVGDCLLSVVLAVHEKPNRTWMISRFRTCWSGRTDRACGGLRLNRCRRTVPWTCRRFLSILSAVPSPSSRGRWTVRRWTWRRWLRVSTWKTTSWVVNGNLQASGLYIIVYVLKLSHSPVKNFEKWTVIEVKLRSHGTCVVF